MRLKTHIKPKEATFHVVLDALALTPFYHAFLITADVPTIYIQVFEDLPLEQDILSFIRDLGHTEDITYLTDVNADYLNQPWRAFSTVINKCLSGKETGMDKIHLSRAQILLGMFHKNNIDYVYLLWEDLLFQIEYKDAKKTNKMRNKMFWHTAQDDTLFTSIRCISIHEDTQVYGTILPTELTNQAMLESKAYQTYYAFAYGEKAPKPKYIRKKADSDTSPKKKPVQATKGTRLNSKPKVAKPDKKKQPEKKIKAKGLVVLSKVALTEFEQIKLATKRSKKDFHVSHASSSGDGVDTQSKVPDEQHQKTSSTDEGTGEDEDDNDDDGESDDHDDESDDKRTETDSDEIPDLNLTNVDQTEYEEEDVDDRFRTPSDYELTDDEKLNDEETMDDKEQEEEDAHVTLTLILDAHKADEPVQSSFVSFDFTSKLLNLENPSPDDNKIASLLETSAHHATTILEIASGFTTTTPSPTLFFNPLLQQQTPTFTTTTSTNPTVTLPEIPNFASVFKFDQRVSALESEISELRQTNQFSEVVSSISGIVDTYLASKIKEAVDADSTMKTIIKDQVKAQVSKIMPKIEKYVTEYQGAKVLVRSTNQPQMDNAVAASLSEFELKNILLGKIKANKSIKRSDNQKNLYNALVETYNSNKDMITSYGDVVLLKKGRDDQDIDEDPSAVSDRGTDDIK
ncbi:hypothetical protein Tco_1279885 [Tanacetum coccineum]